MIDRLATSVQHVQLRKRGGRRPPACQSRSPTPNQISLQPSYYRPTHMTEKVWPSRNRYTLRGISDAACALHFLQVALEGRSRERAMPLSNDGAVSGDEVRLRHTAHAVGHRGWTSGAGAIGVRDVELLDECQRVFVDVLHVDADEADPIAIALPAVLEDRRLLGARHAPRCPEVDHDRTTVT